MIIATEKQRRFSVAIYVNGFEKDRIYLTFDLGNKELEP